MSSIKKVALVAVFLVMKQLAFAQAPWVFPFQAVARYPNSGVIASKAIKVRFTIKDASTTGTTVYQETQSPTTSALGLFSVNIGSGGTSVTGTISTLTWGTSLKFLQVEMDTTNAGTSYVSLGTQQLLSVPYALNAASVGPLPSDLTVNGILFGRGGGNLIGNVAFGPSALSNNTSGTSNTATGPYALNANTTGNYNTANGYGALSNNTTGSNNIATGSYALYSNTTGGQNGATGYFALYSNTTGSQNVANGYSALSSNTTGSQNVANGYAALQNNTTGYFNIANGPGALQYNTTGYGNGASGQNALQNNTTGFYNIANGLNSMGYTTTGNYNVANGVNSLILNITGNYNNGYGFQSVYSNTTGSENVGVGTSSLYNNTTGGQNTALGNGADVTSGALTNATAIGYTAKVAASNTIQLGNTSVTSVKTNGIITAKGITTRAGTGANPGGNCFNFHWDGSNCALYVDNTGIGWLTLWSDRRLKDSINSMQQDGISKLMRLRPVSFHYKNIPNSIFKGNPIMQEGFIADELQTIIPSAVNGDKDALTSDGGIQPQSLNALPVISVLTKAMQEQQAQITVQQGLITAQQKQIDELKAMVDALMKK